MKRIKPLQTLLLCCLACVLSLLAWPAKAQILEEIEINGENGIGEIRIRLSEQIHLLRHFPEDKGERLEIFFRVLTAANVTPRQVDETRHSPPSKLVPPFTVTIPIDGQPRCILRFQRPVNFKVRLGEDNRSLVVYVLHS